MTDTNTKFFGKLDQPTGNPSRQMAVLRARCIARYRLHSIPGRPEELESNAIPLRPEFQHPKRISFGYIHGSVRIRQHGGESNREWVDYLDITFREGWLAEVTHYLDPFFGYVDPSKMTAALQATGGKLEFDITPIITRPIRDNPQA